MKHIRVTMGNEEINIKTHNDIFIDLNSVKLAELDKELRDTIERQDKLTTTDILAVLDEFGVVLTGLPKWRA
jgi:hypothetical protein